MNSSCVFFQTTNEKLQEDGRGPARKGNGPCRGRGREGLEEKNRDHQSHRQDGEGYGDGLGIGLLPAAKGAIIFAFQRAMVMARFRSQHGKKHWQKQKDA
jgi:hypothetical protein